MALQDDIEKGEEEAVAALLAAASNELDDVDDTEGLSPTSVYYRFPNYSRPSVIGTLLVPKKSSHLERIPSYQNLPYSESPLW